MAQPTIPLRQLGTNGPKVPALGFGCLPMSGGYGLPPSDEERFKILDRAYELGARNWDSADIYGDNEILLGKWFARTNHRSSIFLATKFGIQMEGMTHKGVDSSYDYCMSSCEKSLKKLGVEYIDLYYAHRLNPKTPIEETMRALKSLRDAGKIKHIGLCEVSSAALRRAVKIAPVAAVQLEYSIFVRDVEGESGTNLLATCRELGIAMICSSPLGRGFFTARFDSIESLSGPGDFRAKMFPWYKPENFEVNLKLVKEFRGMADRKGCTAAQLGLAWLLKQGEDIVPIPGSKQIKYLEENWGALDVVLSDEEEREIRAFVESAELSGYRSVSGAQNFDFVDTVEDTVTDTVKDTMYSKS